MKRNKWKIGEQRPKRSFPVVTMRLRPVEIAETCVAPDCQSLEYFSERPKAAFLAQVCADIGIASMEGLSQKEQGERVWQNAYRDQLAGNEPRSLGLPLCTKCVACTIARYLGGEKYQQQAAMFMALSVGKGQDLVLFDRNLSRMRTDPAVVVGPFETLADFRRKYWESLETDA